MVGTITLSGSNNPAVSGLNFSKPLISVEMRIRRMQDGSHRCKWGSKPAGGSHMTGKPVWGSHCRTRLLTGNPKNPRKVAPRFSMWAYPSASALTTSLSKKTYLTMTSSSTGSGVMVGVGSRVGWTVDIGVGTKLAVGWIVGVRVVTGVGDRGRNRLNGRCGFSP